MELHYLTLAARSYALLVDQYMPVCLYLQVLLFFFLSLPSPPTHTLHTHHTHHTHFSTSGQNDDELNVNANDTIVIIQNLGDGWLRVRKGQDEGYVPESYVRIVDE